VKTSPLSSGCDRGSPEEKGRNSLLPLLNQPERRREGCYIELNAFRHRRSGSALAERR